MKIDNIKKYGNDNFDFLDDFHPESLALKKRVLTLSGELTEEITQYLCINLLVLEFLDRNADITIHICGEGQVFNFGFAIYDVIKTISCRVITVCTGIAEGAASIVFAAGDYRLIMPRSLMVFNFPHPRVSGPMADVQVGITEVLKIKKIQMEILSNISKLSEEKIEELCEKEKNLTAAECVELGLAHEILVSRKMNTSNENIQNQVSNIKSEESFDEKNHTENNKNPVIDE